MSNKHDLAKAGRCPFCREPMSENKEETRKRLMKRIKANVPAALKYMGGRCYDDGDYDGAFEYWAKAAGLGNVDAHCQLGYMYWKGEGVEKDDEKVVYHYEKAAIGGHPGARYILAILRRKMERLKEQ